MNPEMRTKRRVKRYYSRLSQDYDNVRFGNDKTRFISSLQVQWILRETKGKRGIFLDVGCGTGRISLPLLRQSNFVVGVDVERRMIEMLRETTKELRLWSFMNCVVADVEHLPFKDEIFDIITSVRVIWHVPNCKSVLEKITKIVKRGGILLMDFPNAIGIWAALSHVSSRNFEVLTQFTTKGAIEKIGHESRLSVCCSGHVSPVLHLVPIGIFNRLKGLLEKIELLGRSRILGNLFTYYLIRMMRR